MLRPQYSLSELVARLGGQIQGDATTQITQVATLEHAGAGQIAFLANSKYRKQLEATAASAVIVTEADAEATQLPCIISNNPYSYFAKLSALLNPPTKYAAGIHPSAVVGEGAKIAPSVYIAANVVIGAGAKIGAGGVIMEGCSVGAGTVLGDNARLYPNVVIYHNCQIGHNFIGHSGAVIGSDGFGLAMEAGRWLKIPQIGRVVIGDDVEVGANTTIDRGALDDTVIEDDVKLDNQIQVAHNVRIGSHTAIAGCVGIAGSTVIGRYCQLGGSAMILGHLQIADKVVISAGTLISKSVRESGTYTAIFPFSETHEWRKNAVHLRRLDEMFDRIKTLEAEIVALRKS
jgi:UDP-3-O-[3-hydroxymyristoyl] glucosamine N-acyltransferase